MRTRGGAPRGPTSADIAQVLATAGALGSPPRSAPVRICRIWRNLSPEYRALLPATWSGASPGSRVTEPCDLPGCRALSRPGHRSTSGCTLSHMAIGDTGRFCRRPSWLSVSIPRGLTIRARTMYSRTGDPPLTTKGLPWPPKGDSTIASWHVHRSSSPCGVMGRRRAWPMSSRARFRGSAPKGGRTFSTALSPTSLSFAAGTMWLRCRRTPSYQRAGPPMRHMSPIRSTPYGMLAPSLCRARHACPLAGFVFLA